MESKSSTSPISSQVAPPFGAPSSYWIESTETTQFPQATSVTVDVAIVGAGIAGITAAKVLKEAGKTVALIEAGEVACGSTGGTTAKITSLHRTIYNQLIDSKGEEKAKLYGQAAEGAIAQIVKWIEEEQIDCDFSRQNAYTFALTEKDIDQVKKEVEAAQRLGLPAQFVTQTSLPFAIAGAVEFSNQAQFHVRKYMLHLVKKIPGEGSYLFEHTRVTDVKEEKSACRVLTEQGEIQASDVLVTTNLPILDIGLFFAKSFPQRSYIIAAPIAPEAAPQGMFIGVGTETHSIRTTPYKDGKLLLLVGGEGHKVGEKSETETCYRNLEDYAQRHFEVDEIAYRWSNQDVVSFDKVPFVGPLTPTSQHIYVATGFNLWGMTNGTSAGMVLADLVLAQDNPYTELYDSLRVDPIASTASLKQNLDVGRHWVGDRLKGLTQFSFDSVKPGNGKIITHKGEKVAAYRDEAGAIHACSAVCSHLGCIVNWNSAEQSWDCPCHGARFNADGKVMCAPAVHDLEPVSLLATEFQALDQGD